MVFILGKFLKVGALDERAAAAAGRELAGDTVERTPPCDGTPPCKNYREKAAATFTRGIRFPTRGTP